MFERISIIGRLGRDPELRQTRGQDPVPVTNFSVAVNYRDANGNEKTKWFEVSAWRGLAGPCAEYLAKGDLVYVEGTVTASVYTAQDGSIQPSLQINAKTIKFLQSNRDNRDNFDDNFAGEIDDEDIPF